jgi:hypothetical protein
MGDKFVLSPPIFNMPILPVTSGYHADDGITVHVPEIFYFEFK